MKRVSRQRGEVTEWPIVLDSKSSVGSHPPRVRIPPSPLQHAARSCFQVTSGSVVFIAVVFIAVVRAARTKTPTRSVNEGEVDRRPRSNFGLVPVRELLRLAASPAFCRLASWTICGEFVRCSGRAGHLFGTTRFCRTAGRTVTY